MTNPTMNPCIKCNNEPEFLPMDDYIVNGLTKTLLTLDCSGHNCVQCVEVHFCGKPEKLREGMIQLWNTLNPKTLDS